MIQKIDVDAYKLTDTCKTLENEIDKQIEQKYLTYEQKEEIILFAAYEYRRYVNSDQQSWNTIKNCLLQIPIPMSIIDIIKCRDACSKHYLIVYKKNQQETLEIFHNFNIKPDTYEVIINNVPQIVFSFIEKYDTNKLLHNWEDVGHRIFKEIECHLLPIDYCYYFFDKKEEVIPHYIENYIDMSFSLRIMRCKSDDRNSAYGYRKDLECAFRSSWEANVARILNYLNIKWEYEKTSFDRFALNTVINQKVQPKVNYFPDFIIDNNIVLEIKGFWDQESRNKAIEFVKHYSEFSYNIIDNDMYYTIRKLYQPIISEWEDDGLSRIKSETLQIVGLSFGERKYTYSTLKVGDEVIFERDCKNQYDSNAILALTVDNKEIGFISADWACIYAPKIDMGMKFDAKVVSIEQKVIYIKVKRNNPESEIIYDFLKR